MRTVRGNDPFTAIRQLHPSPNILSITHLSKSHMKQHEERSGDFSSSFFFKHSENRLERQREPSGWGNLRKSAKKNKQNKKRRELKTYLKPSWCGRWHASISFTFAQTVSFLSIPWHIHSPLSMLSTKWKGFCTLFLAAVPTVVITTLPLSSSLPHAGFLCPLIFSSASSLALSASLGSTYNISLFLRLSPFCSSLLF